MASRGALERAHVRTALIRDLATGGHTRRQLAARYGVAHPSIVEFAQRHADEVTALRARLAEIVDNTFAHLWIADKVSRVAEYQQDAEDADAILADAEAIHAGVQWAETKRIKAQALRAVAEELGQLPSRHTLQHEGGVSVRYVIEGVDMDALT
jgi:hypothetical protein